MDLKLAFEDSFQNFESSGDLEFTDNDAVLDYGLTTLVLVSLYTDVRAFDDDEIPDGTTNRRGWWGDSISDTEDDTIGSRLWLLARSAATNENLNLARDYMTEALEWMIEDGIVAEIDVETERLFHASDGSYTLGARISLLRASGETVALNFADLWAGQYEIE